MQANTSMLLHTMQKEGKTPALTESPKCQENIPCLINSQRALRLCENQLYYDAPVMPDIALAVSANSGLPDTASAMFSLLPGWRGINNGKFTTETLKLLKR